MVKPQQAFKLVAAGALALGSGIPAGAQGPRHARPVLPAIAPGAAHSPASLDRMFDAAKAHPVLSVSAPSRPVKEPPMRPLEGWVERPSADRLHQQLVVPVPKETPAYSRTFRHMLAQPEKTDRWDNLIIKYARRYRLDARLLKSIMAAESEFDPSALSPAGARGLMQVMPVTALTVGVTADRLHDPEHGIKAGAAYVQTLFKAAWKIFKLKGVRYTDVPYWLMQRVVAAYHAGPKFLFTSRWFKSTQAYVRKVSLFYQSKVTDLRRPVAARLDLPDHREMVAPAGTLY